MTLSNSDLAYTDCYKLFDQALDARKGIRIEYGSESMTNYQASRFNKARTLDRIKNCSIHPEGAPLHGKSIYDAISIRKRSDNDGVWYVVLVKIEAAAEGLRVEELSDEYDAWEAPKLPPPRVELELLPAPQVDGEPQEFGPKVRRI